MNSVKKGKERKKKNDLCGGRRGEDKRYAFLAESSVIGRPASFLEIEDALSSSLCPSCAVKGGKKCKRGMYVCNRDPAIHVCLKI